MAAPDNFLGLATNSNGTWDNIIVDSVPTYIGTFSSIAIDPFGKVHISYVDYNPDGELKYATNSTGNWSCEYVDNQANINSPTSMALDSELRAHIAYYDWFHADLKYATNANGSWTYIHTCLGKRGWTWSVPRIWMRMICRISATWMHPDR